MSLTPGQLNGMHGPIGNVLLQANLVPFDMEAADFGKYFRRVTIPGPTFELPGLKKTTKIGIFEVSIINMNINFHL